MQAHELPNSINPTRLAEKQATLTGIVYLANMSRLKEFLADTTGEAAIAMNFGYDESHVLYIHLIVNVTLILTCQRCMENFNYPIAIDILLSPLVETEKMPNTANTQNHAKRATKVTPRSQNKAYEPMVMENETLILQDMVEDEILLNLPLVPKHTQDTCSVVLSTSNEDETENPFMAFFRNNWHK